MKITVKLQPQELTSLMDKDMIVSIRQAFVQATKQAEEDGDNPEGTYASIPVEDFVELLKSSGVIPPEVCDKITEHIDVNDDGDIDFDEFINFVLAAESNLEYSKQHGMERFALSTTKGLDDSRDFTRESLYTLSYTGNPLSMVVGGGSSGEVYLFNSMSFRLLGKFPYESKAMAIRDNLMTGITKRDQPVLKARLKEEVSGGKNTLDKVELVCSCVLPNTPSMLVMGAADSSFAIFDISSQTSRLSGAVGRINSLTSPPTSLLAVQDKVRHYGEHAADGGGGNMEGGPGDGPSSPGESRVGAALSVSSSLQGGKGGGSPGKPLKGATRLGTLTEGGGSSVASSPTAKGGTTHKASSSEEDPEVAGTEKSPVQTIYVGCSDGRLYWLPLDGAFGTASEKEARQKNKKLFEDSVLRAAGKGALLAGRSEELDNQHKSHEQKAIEILGFRKYLTKEEAEEPLKPWERPGQRAAAKKKKRREEQAEKAKQKARDDEKFRNLHLPYIQLHTDAITKSLYLPERDCVVSSSLDGTISFFSHKAKTQLHHFKGTYREAAKNGIACMAHSAKNKFIISSAERGLYAWDVTSEEITHRLTDLPALVSQVEVDDRNDIIVALLDGGTVMVWGSLNFELRQTLDGRGPLDDLFGGFGRRNRNSEEIITKLLLFDNKEIARTEAEKVAQIEKAMAEKNPAAAMKKGGKDGGGSNLAMASDDKHCYTMCLGGDLLNLWRFGSSGAPGEEDGGGSDYKLGLQSEDLVTAIFNSNFKLFIVLYSLGTCKVFSALSGACMREFVVSETDPFGKMMREKLERDAVTGLIRPVVKNACLDCTQRRLMVMMTDDTVKVWNFFAGQKIDQVDLQLPLAAVPPEPAPSVSVSVSAQAGPVLNKKEVVTGNGKGQGGGEGLTALEEASRQLVAEKAEKALALASRKERRGPMTESTTTMSMVEMTGVEKRGRDKFTVRTLVVGCTGATVNFFHDKGENISDSAMSIFKWSKRPIDYRSMLLEHEKSQGGLGGSSRLSTGLDSDVSSERAAGEVHHEGGGPTGRSQEGNTVLWDVYMDFKGNTHNNGLAVGSGNGVGHGRNRGSYLVVGYSNGTCTVFDANLVKVISRIDPASVGTLLHGMKLKLKNHTEVDAAEAVQQEQHEARPHPRSRSTSTGQSGSPSKGLSEVQEESIHVHPSSSKPTPIIIDCAVGVYEPLIRVVIGACSDRYMKIFDADSGTVLCSMSYIHEEAGMEGVYTGGGESLWAWWHHGGKLRLHHGGGQNHPGR